MKKEDIISIDKRIYKFLWNKKWDGQCPDRIKRQVMKNSYENGGIKAPDTGALNKALKVKQYMNATKSKNKINILQKLFTSEAAPNSMVQMVYKANECQNGFIRTALETINEMNNIAFTNYCSTLMKIRTQQADITSITPYLEYYQSLDSRALYIENEEARNAVNIFVTRGIKTMEKTISEILYPTVAVQAGFLNRRTIKNNIPTQILRGLQICRENGIQCIPGDDIKLPNCTNTKWTIENITTKDIRTALISEHLIIQDLEHVRIKFNFTEADM